MKQCSRKLSFEFFLILDGGRPTNTNLVEGGTPLCVGSSGALHFVKDLRMLIVRVVNLKTWLYL